MLIALDYSLVGIQRRLGHRKPDTTLRVYAHQWKHREARRSQIGVQLERLFDDSGSNVRTLPKQRHGALFRPLETGPPARLLRQ